MNLTGRVISHHFKVGKKIDEGSTSAVYLAENLKDRRKYVLKVLKQEIKSQRSEDVIRFRKEANFVSRLNHPSIIKIYEVGEYLGYHYMLMEHVPGQSLDELIRKSFNFKESEIVEMLCQLCHALSYVHNQGIIHRDLKPANIMRRKRGNHFPVWKILDFGLVELMEFSKITKQEEIAGTFSYMSPEQSGIVRKPIDGRSDLYSLGIILYQLLTGELPFKGRDINTILHQQVAKTPEPPHVLKKGVSPDLERIVLKLLKKEPEERYQTAVGLHNDLLKYQGGDRDFALGLSDRFSKLPYRTRLIGRDEEVAKLKGLFDGANGGRGGICLISGNAGSGKTRLAEELRSYVLARRGRLLGGKCFAQDNKIPYQPWSEVLHEYICLLDKTGGKNVKHAAIKKMREMAGDLGEIICRINPLMRKYLGDVKTLVPLDAERENKRFLMVASRFFCGLGAPGEAIVLVLDDLQWSDQGSLCLLEEIAHEIPNSPLLVLAAFRDNEVADNHGLLKLKQEHSLLHLNLAPFDFTRMKNLVAELMMDTTGNMDRLSRYILGKSKGNPFFAIEITRRLVDEKIVFMEQEGWQVNWEGLKSIKIPGSIIDTVLKRIVLLSFKEKNLLSYAAVIGCEFEMDLLYTLSDLPKEDVVGVVDKALELQLLEQNQQKKGSILFVHDRIKDAFYKMIGEEKRRDLHLKVAAILERLKPAEPDALIFALAHHYSEGGDREKTLAYAIPASGLAKKRHANEEALRYFAMACQILEKKGQKGGSVWLKIKQGLGDVYLTIGRNDEALKILNETLPYANGAVAKARIYRQVSTVYFKKGDWRNCEKYGQAGLKLLGEKLPITGAQVVLSMLKELTAHLLHIILPGVFMHKTGSRVADKYGLIIWFYMVLNWMYVLSDTTKFIRSILRMLNLSESKIGKSRELGSSMSGYASLCMALPFFRRALKYHKMGWKLRTEYGDEWGAAQSLQLMGYCYEWKGEYGKSIACYRDCIKRFQKIGDIWETGAATLGVSYNYFFLADYEQTTDLLQQYLEISEKLNDDFGRCSAKNWLLHCFAKRGEFPKAEEYARQSLALSKEKKIWFAYFTALARLGDLKLEDNDFKKAKLFLEQAYKLNEENSFLKNYNVFIYPYLASAYIMEYRTRSNIAGKKERHRALKHIKKLSAGALAKTRSWTNYYGEALRVRARYYALNGGRNRAKKYFLKGSEHHQRLGQRYELAKDYYEYGIFLNECGNREGAERQWRLAYDLFKETGAQVYVKRTKSLLGLEEKETEQDQLLSKRRLSSVISLSQYISSILDLEKLLDKIIDTVIQVTGAQRGYLLIRDDATGRLEVKAARHMEKETILQDDFQFSRHIISQVYDGGEMIITTDAGHDQKYLDFRSVAAYGLKSVLCAPIKYQNKVTGVCYLDNPLTSSVFSSEDAEILSVFVSQAAICIENAKSYQASKELTQELEQKVAKRTRDLRLANQKLRKANKELKEADLEKTDFFVNLTHEIKTPLTLINNYLEDYIQKSGITFDLKIIKQNFNKLLKDMVNFFDILRFEKGIRIYSHNQVVDLTGFVEKKVELFKKIASKQQIAITTDLEQKVYLKADILAMERIVNNLLDNAIKYNKPGGKIDIALRIKKGRIEVVVSDSGIGMARDKIAKIFLPYYQISHKKQNIQGIGVGLAIVKNIVNSLDGRILVESRPGQGSSFKIILPRYKLKPAETAAGQNQTVQDEETPLAEETDFLETAGRNRDNILLVEDNRELLHFLRNKLAAVYNVYCAANGQEAMDKLPDIPQPDVIVSDIMMDQVDGYDFLDKLLAMERYKDIPFIFITAKTKTDEKIKGLKKGAIDYIYKPFVVDELIAKINSLTRHEAQKKENYERDKFASLGMLMGGIAHEIFNPLSGISGPLENIKKHIGESPLKDNPHVDKHIHYIEKSIVRIEQIIRNIQALYSEGALKIETVDIGEMVEAVFAYYKDRGNNRIIFQTRIDESLCMQTARDALFQVLSNLVANAIDSIEDAGQVTVSAGKKDDNLIIKVSDTGKGIASEEADRIFNAFYTTKQVRNGTGLGLYLVKNFILKMNWDIRVESVPGKGSTFTITAKN